MVTKLKKISYSSTLKILICITLSIIVCLISIFSTEIISFSNNISFNDIINNNKTYEQSDFINDEYSYIVDSIVTLLYYKDKENIEIIAEKELLDEEYNDYDENYYDENHYDENYSDAIKDISEKYTQDFNYLVNKLKSMNNIYYYTTDGEVEFSNSDKDSEPDFKKFKSYLLLDNIEKIIEFQESNNYYPIERNNLNQFDSKIYIAFTDEYIEKQQEEYISNIQIINKTLKIISLLLLISILFVVYLIFTAGKKYNSNKIHFTFIDRLYTDINIIIHFLIIFFYFIFFDNISNTGFILSEFKYEYWSNNAFNILALICILVVFMTIILLLSLIRHLKAGSIIKHSLSYKIIKYLINFIKEILDNGPLYIFTPVLFILFSISFFIFFVSYNLIQFLSFLSTIIIFTGSIIFSILFFKQLDFIKKEIKNIRNGNLENKITESKITFFSSIAKDLNYIKSGQRKIISKEIKSERMKTELITNVSHDLKTPLTSIVNYVDLLEKENLKPAEANDYVKVLKTKVTKLKNLTKDLFEIASIQDGKININKNDIDIILLLKQSFAEYEKYLSNLKLDVIFNIKVKTNFIKSDGKILSRVFENLILNITKYSMENTRIYIDVFEVDNTLTIEFKNIANYKMNFNSEDITERFTRGDKSRSTEGNGLGLAIARSYIEEVGGFFEIKVDGDLFKASIKL